MGEVRTAEPRWRLDAVALAVSFVGIAITACVVTYQPATGVPNQFGPASDQVSGRDPLPITCNDGERR